MIDEQDNGDIRKGIKLDEDGCCIACHGTGEVETAEGWNLGCSYCSTDLDKANARIAQLNERVGELEGLLLDAMTQGCSDVEGEFDTGAISTWRDIGEYLVKANRLAHSRPGTGRRMFYRLKEQP